MNAAKASLFGMLLVATGADLARAESQIDFGEIAVDGLTVQNAKCTLGQGDLFAGMQLVASLAKRKDALDKCTPAPAGGAFEVGFTLDGAKLGKVAVTRSSQPSANECVTRAFDGIEVALSGRCALVVLTGDLGAARRAAAALK